MIQSLADEAAANAEKTAAAGPLVSVRFLHVYIYIYICIYIYISVYIYIYKYISLYRVIMGL